jgi:phosphoribosyl 1,2-cyclic phosphodiesterase
MEMTFCPLFSGSSGNALYVATERTRLLVDAGLPGKAVVDALCQIGVNPASLSAILITHEHSDHVKGAGILSRKFNLPIYATPGTWYAMERTIGPVSQRNRREFYPDTDFYVDEIGVTPFMIPHDAAEPVGYRLSHSTFSVATATDMGIMRKNVLEQLAGVDLLLLESNHDPEMLRQNPHYSQALKKRILGNKGHLSNDACAEAVLSLVETGVRHVVLGHLSAENNLPELAYSTTCRLLSGAGLVCGKDVTVDMAWRDRVGNVYVIRDGRMEKAQRCV